MKPKHLLALVLIVGGLGSYIYFGIQKPAEKKAADGIGEKILPGELNQLQSIQLELKTGKIELQKESDLWRLTQPVKDLASESKVKNLISALEKFRKTKSIGGNKIEQFGLKEPKVVLTYKTSSMQEPFQIRIGDQNPSYSGTYAQVGKDPAIILAGLDLDYLATQKAEDFREMKISTVAPENYDQIEIAAKGKKVSFKRIDGEWRMASPFQLPLDAEFVRGQIEKVSLIRANSFLDKVPKLPKEDPVRVVIGFKEGQSDLRTSKNDSRPNGTEILLYKDFAKSDKTDWASVSKFHFENLSKEPEDYIKKTFDDFLIGDVEKISISQPGKKDFDIVRKAENFEGFDAAAVEDILRQLRNMRALRFLNLDAKPKVAKPSLHIQLALKGNEVRDYIFELKKDIGELWIKSKDAKGSVIWMRYLMNAAPIKASTFEFEHLTKAKDSKKE